MLPEFLTLEVVTPERRVVEDSVHEVQLPGREGYLGILPGHTPLMTELGSGILSYRKGLETFYLTALRGFAEVLPDRVIVLAEAAERAEEIDLARARAALERARERLARVAAEPEINWERAAASLERAMVRLQVAAKGGAAAAAAQETPRSAP
jgi:F-type H+-transporting ATPase subunit epsilon